MFAQNEPDEQYPEWMKLRDAAKYLEKDERTLRRYIKTGLLPAYRRGPRELLIKRADLDAMIKPVG